MGIVGMGLLALSALAMRSAASIWQGAIQAVAFGLLGAGAGALKFVVRDGHDWADALVETKVGAVATFVGGAMAIVLIRRFLKSHIPDDRLI